MRRQEKGKGEVTGQAPGLGDADVGQAPGLGGAQDYGLTDQGRDADVDEVRKKRGGDYDDDEDDNKEEMGVTNPGGDSGAVGKSEDSDSWICRGRNPTWIREH